MDSTVKIWDLSKGGCVHTCEHHKAGVNKVQWSSNDVSVLLTAGSDGKISVLDSRFPADEIVHMVPEGQ